MFSQLAKGSKQALAQIHAQYAPLLIRRMHRLYPNPQWEEEVLSDIMQLLWEKRKEIIHHDNPEAWLFMIARRQYIDKIKYEKRRSGHFPLQEWQGMTDTIEQDLEQKELQNAIEEGVLQLTKLEQAIFWRYRDGLYSREELAHYFKVTESTLKNHVTTIRRKLGEWLLKKQGKDK